MLVRVKEPQLFPSGLLLLNSAAARHGLWTARSRRCTGANERHAVAQALVDASTPRAREGQILAHVFELVGFALQPVEVALLRAREPIEIVAPELRQPVLRLGQARRVV